MLSCVLEFTSSHHCRLEVASGALPPSTNIVGLSDVDGKSRGFYSVQENPALSRGVVRISGLFAFKVGLRSKALVSVDVVSTSPILQSVIAAPHSDMDYEIILENSDQVVLQTLSQISVVWPGAIFPLWLALPGSAKPVCVFLTVREMRPAVQCGLMRDAVTDLEVLSANGVMAKDCRASPQETSHRSQAATGDRVVVPASTLASATIFLSDLFTALVRGPEELLKPRKMATVTLPFCSLSRAVTARVCLPQLYCKLCGVVRSYEPLTHIDEGDSSSMALFDCGIAIFCSSQLEAGFLYSSHMRRYGEDGEDYCVLPLYCVAPRRTNAGVYCASHIWDLQVPRDHVALPPCFSASPLERLRFIPVVKSQHPDGAELVTSATLSGDAAETRRKLQHLLSLCGELPCSRSIRLPGHAGPITVTLKTTSDAAGVVTLTRERVMKLLEEPHIIPREHWPVQRTSDIVLWPDVLDRATFLVKSLLDYPNTCHRGLLITGDSGSGRTTFISQLVVRLHEELIGGVVLSCKSLVSKGAGSIAKQLSKSFESAFYSEPCVLVLDDLDALIRAPKSDDPADSFQLHKILAALDEEQRTYSGRRVVLVATVSDVEFLSELEGRSLAAARFPAQLRLPPLSQAGAQRLISHWTPGVSVSKVADLTRHLSLAELQLFSSRLKLQMKTSQRCEDNVASEVVGAQLLAEMKGQFSRPIWNPRTELALHQVPGMANAAHVLKRLFLTKDVRVKVPMSAPPAALLYGYPGCGKSLLASALSRSLPHTAVIEVRGPELLNKFVGSSEAAVRELFSRASRLAPALIMFEHFESLAPIRGSDSTGVTDRVVNQLLTELDGVESRKVSVLAISSRPDLIDPAVLRPGRIASHIFCDYPTDQDRYEIIKHLAGPHKQQIDCGILAGLTVGYFPADLLAVFHAARAQLAYGVTEAAAAAILANQSLQSHRGSESSQVRELATSDLEAAIAQHKLLINSADAAQYKECYERFSGKRFALDQRVLRTIHA